MLGLTKLDFVMKQKLVPRMRQVIYIRNMVATFIFSFGKAAYYHICHYIKFTFSSKRDVTHNILAIEHLTLPTIWYKPSTTVV